MRRGGPFHRHGRHNHNGYGKSNQKQIRDNIASAHSDELRITLSTFGPGIRHDLPVVVERLTFGKRRNDHACEGNEEEVSDEL